MKLIENSQKIRCYSNVELCVQCSLTFVKVSDTWTHVITFYVGELSLSIYTSMYLVRFCNYKKKQFERSPVQDTFLITNHYLNSMIF